jgi:uncharacterized protein YneR
MKLTVTPEAAKWFREELRLKDGDTVRIFVRYGGGTVIYPGFSLGVCVESPKSVAAMVEVEGNGYFVREGDAAFLDERELKVVYNANEGDIEFLVNQAS